MSRDDIEQLIDSTLADVEQTGRHAAPEPEPEPAVTPKPGKRWRVVRQRTTGSDVEVCRHRWEWTAELHAHWLANRDPNSGVFYNAYPAGSAS